MRYLLLIIYILVHGYCAAVTFAEDYNWYPVGKIGAKKIYIGKNKQSKCEKKENHPCGNISGKNLAYHKMGKVDDISKPKFKKKSEMPCSDRESCQTALGNLDCSAHADGTMKIIAADYTEIYCAEPNGFKKKNVLVIDSALKAKYDSDKAAKQAEKSARATAKTSRRTQLDNCRENTKGKTGSLTGPQVKKCIRAILRELEGDKIPVSDL